jgi:hypothetical protein
MDDLLAGHLPSSRPFAAVLPAARFPTALVFREAFLATVLGARFLVDFLAVDFLADFLEAALATCRIPP